MTSGDRTRSAEGAGVPAIEGFVVRHFDAAGDFRALAELITAVNINDGVDWLPSADALRNDWTHTDGFVPAEDVLVVDLDGVPAAYVEHAWRIRGDAVHHAITVAVAPAVRRRGIGRALLEWAESHVARGLAAGSLGADLEIPHVLVGWADLEVDAVLPWATNAGYQVEGYGMLMKRPLGEPISDLALPEGLEVRPVRPEDHRAIWDADTEAFQDHRDPDRRTEADFERWFRQPDLDTSLWQVAWDGDEVAGSVMNVVFKDENARLGVRRGWLEHVSVRRPWRKRGIASALITRSMLLLRAAGLDEAVLGADTENLSGAVRLYEGLGFARARTGARYRKAIAAPGGSVSPDTRPR